MKNIKYDFEIGKIVKFLNRFKDNLPELYKWNPPISGLFELGVLSESKINSLNLKSPYEKEVELKGIIKKELIERNKNANRNPFDELSLWIIKEWGGIKGSKDSNTLKVIYEFLNQSNYSFKRIASTSKIHSFMYPEESIIYDSRVAYSLNWIILSEKAGDFFFPTPEGRNSKMSAFDINVLIRLEYIKNYIPKSMDELRNKQFVNNQDKIKYIPKNEAYTELNRVITLVSQNLWTKEKSKKLYYTEMLLFSLADSEIYNDIANRVTVNIK